MSSRLLKKLVAVTLAAAILSYAPVSLACGPFTLSAVFTFTVHPEYPLERFASGDIGIVQPTYARSYLVVAYRHLNGSGFNEVEQQALVSLWRQRLNYNWTESGEDAAKQWLAARAKVPGVGDAPNIEVYRTREKPNDYDAFLNCQNDAFKNAETALAERLKKWGADSAALKDWITAQDLVFANCGEGKNIPTAAPADADPLLKADRAYQIAAANFYATDFVTSRSGFEAIARDKSSPWQPIAPYLVARTFVREASLGPAEKRQEPLTAAEQRLNEVLKDQTLARSHVDASRLLGLVRLRLHPEDRARELGQILLTKNQNEALKQNLWDYTALLDQFVIDPEADKEKDVPAELRRDDLTDWIGTLQSEKPEAVEHAIQKWQASASLPWLVASLTKITASHPQAAQLIAAASNVEPSLAAYPSVSFHTARLAIQGGSLDKAKAVLDYLLTNRRNQFNASSLNLVLGQRMLLAPDVNEFLKYAQRAPAGLSWDDDGRELPADESSESADEERSIKGKILLDVDSSELFNRKFPLSVWRQAAESKTLPAHLRIDVAQAAFLRAVILGDFKTADALAPTLKALLPEVTSYLAKYLAATQPDAKKFSALYLWLNFPGFEPVVDAGIGRHSMAFKDQDSYRDNWWCTAAFPPDKEPSSDSVAAAAKEVMPAFLSSAQRSAGEKDSATLNAIGAAPNYLAREVIQWATRSPADSRVPEALHLAVKSTRYGCTDKQTGRWSKAAFDLLHRRYPKSEWAAKTPYWFKE